MRKKKQQAVKLEDLLAPDKKSVLREKYKISLKEAKGDDPDKLIDDLGLKLGKYSLRTAIKRNPWLIKGRPASSALSWLSKTVFRNPHTYRYSRNLLHQGGLFTFEYKNQILRE